MADLRPCPACDASDAAKLAKYSRKEWHVARCASCNLTYLRNPVAYEALEEEFAWEKTYETKSQAGGSTALSPSLKKIRTKTGLTHRGHGSRMGAWFNNGHVLDIGCGAKTNVPEPMTPYGIELSRKLHKIADRKMRARGGYCVHGAGAEAIWDFEPEMFDGIVMQSYLEHEVDLMRVLNGAWRVMKPAAPMYVRVPNFGSINRYVIGRKWCGFRYPDHVTYFTVPTLRDVARRAGFTVEVVNRATVAIDDNIKALLRKAEAPA
ncbi:methyltransferase domain-containing protein [uncultured Tateyamaria sp.]|uniref:class I SAM-dependent methyltransferase n=1 Tax=uncultured Tateyamaria sp. TaxID=455651 RepID=UPI002638AD5F|nr:methyltransferase domain-containing protein [uncultured Tateyamaria sp.]